MTSGLLSAIEVHKRTPGHKSRKLRDENALNLLVDPNGSKYLQLRYTLHGKEKVLQPGIYRKMGLADAKLAERLRANW